MSEELKPCPFCSGEADEKGVLHGDGRTSPECMKCGATAESIKLWNTRADGWISVDDALPTEDGSCWVAFMVDGELYQCEGYYFTRTKLFDTLYEDFPDVLFWRKLPELPVIK